MGFQFYGNFNRTRIFDIRKSGYPERVAAFSYLKDARAMELAIKLETDSLIRLSGLPAVDTLFT
ncbi:MAG: hypothetical protein VX505_12710, partial [Chloroflexota bacterium]|nr:hypothetical protein [Chloroflexota bacterium]